MKQNKYPTTAFVESILEQYPSVVETNTTLGTQEIEIQYYLMFGGTRDKDKDI